MASYQVSADDIVFEVGGRRVPEAEADLRQHARDIGMTFHVSGHVPTQPQVAVDRSTVPPAQDPPYEPREVELSPEFTVDAAQPGIYVADGATMHSEEIGLDIQCSPSSPPDLSHLRSVNVSGFSGTMHVGKGATCTQKTVGVRIGVPCNKPC